MIRNISLTLCLAIAGCDRGGVWYSSAQATRLQGDVCVLSQYYDLVGKVKVESFGEPIVRTFSIWGDSQIRLTPVKFDVKFDVGGIGTGSQTGFLSAPVRDGRIQAESPFRVGSEGWLFGAVVDGVLLLSTDGMVFEKPDGSLDFVHYAKFESEKALEASFLEARKTCPRTPLK